MELKLENARLILVAFRASSMRSFGPTFSNGLFKPRQSNSRTETSSVSSSVPVFSSFSYSLALALSLSLFSLRLHWNYMGLQSHLSPAKKSFLATKPAFPAIAVCQQQKQCSSLKPIKISWVEITLYIRVPNEFALVTYPSEISHTNTRNNRG